jgi:hypothetical protein
MKRLAVAAFTALLLTLAAPAPALAATGVARVLSLDVQMWPEDIATSTTLIVVATVPTGTVGTVTLPLPAGAQMTWAGEIFPDGSAQDVPHSPIFGPDNLTLTLPVRKSNTVQYEAQYRSLKVKGTRRTATLDWVQSAAADITQFAFKLPPDTGGVKTTPAFKGAPATNAAGEKLYIVADQKLKVGDRFTAVISYDKTAQPVVPVAQPRNTLLEVLVALLAVGLVALALLVVRQRRKGAAPPLS